MDNKAEFVYMLECAITNKANGWAQVKLFQCERTTTLFMAITLIIHQNLRTFVPFINCLLVVFVFMLQLPHFYVWHWTMHIPDTINWAILTVIPKTCHQSW
jgi:hypothetical protein